MFAVRPVPRSTCCFVFVITLFYKNTAHTSSLFKKNNRAIHVRAIPFWDDRFYLYLYKDMDGSLYNTAHQLPKSIIINRLQPDELMTCLALHKMRKRAKFLSKAKFTHGKQLIRWTACCYIRRWHMVKKPARHGRRSRGVMSLDNFACAFLLVEIVRSRDLS